MGNEHCPMDQFLPWENTRSRDLYDIPTAKTDVFLSCEKGIRPNQDGDCRVHPGSWGSGPPLGEFSRDALQLDGSLGLGGRWVLEAPVRSPFGNGVGALKNRLLLRAHAVQGPGDQGQWKAGGAEGDRRLGREEGFSTPDASGSRTSGLVRPQPRPDT